MAKLIIIGDSILKGVIYSDNAKKYKLDPLRFGDLEKDGIETKNYSKMGATVRYAEKAVCSRLDSADEQTAVLLEFGGNDCDYNWKEISENPDGVHYPNTDIKDFLEIYKNAVNYARDKGAKVIISNLVPIDADKYMNRLSNGLNYNNILKWLGDVSVLYRWQEYYNSLAETIAQELSCRLIDLRSAFLKSHEYKNLFCSDGIHPTETGHRIIENIIQSSVREVLA